jgi:hypothetical protein
MRLAPALLVPAVFLAGTPSAGARDDCQGATSFGLRR